MRVIVPCCGRSSRYPDQPPKWMLPGVDGRPMLTMAVSGLQMDLGDLAVVILREHEERYGATAGIREAFGNKVEVVVLEEPTANQAETVAQSLERLAPTGGFLVKDSDNRFELAELEQPHNYVSVDSLNNYDLINPRNKSYVQVEHNNVITNIREKEVVSDLFSVGGYYFSDPAQFLDAYQRLAADGTNWSRELYLSDVIAALILDGVPFEARRVAHYQDWGTVHEWKRTLLESRTLFVALDGFLFERGSNFFHPRYQNVKAYDEAVDVVRKARDSGRKVVLLSVRSDVHRALTVAQLHDIGLEDLPILFDCPVTAWSMITAPHGTLPFRTSDALELSPLDPNLEEKVFRL